jgi:hypothetical protein
MLHRYSANSFDCSTPLDVKGGSVGIPVGVLIIEAV